MALTYGHVAVTLMLGTQQTIRPLAVSPSTQITGLRHLVARGKIRSKPLLSQTERITTDNSAELTLWFAQGEGQWQSLFSLWLPNVEAFSRADIMAELSCAPTEAFILAPGFKLGASAARLGGGGFNEDSITLFGDYYQSEEELLII
jgi:hypothetical protein